MQPTTELVQAFCKYTRQHVLKIFEDINVELAAGLEEEYKNSEVDVVLLNAKVLVQLQKARNRVFLRYFNEQTDKDS